MESVVTHKGDPGLAEKKSTQKTFCLSAVFYCDDRCAPAFVMLSRCCAGESCILNMKGVCFMINLKPYIYIQGQDAALRTSAPCTIHSDRGNTSAVLC